ncbi:hypothetical protein G6F68_014075 [Rhizopus microsporus]|nr:hypothetical protein G6F68_014075 [Rhizopus microsporus]
MHDWLAAYRAATDQSPQADYLQPDPVGERVSWWQPQLLPLPDGSQLLMLFLPFDSSHWEVLGLSPVALALLLFALAVTAPLCWALTRHVTAPLTQLRQATHALAAGRLDAQTPPKLAGRKDELGLCCTTSRTNCAHRWRGCGWRQNWRAARMNARTCSWTASNANANAWTHWWATRCAWPAWAPSPSPAIRST